MPDASKPIVSALVVSRNSKEELLQCLQTFFASADVPVEAVVVDNDSSDGSPAAVTDEFPQATVLVQSKNLGYGRAANLGLERCQGRFILLLSPSVLLDPQGVGRLADFMFTRPDAGAVGPQVVFPDGRLDPDARRDSYERHRAMWTYHFKHHSEDVSAFGNGLVWAQIWGRYAAERLRDTLRG